MGWNESLQWGKHSTQNNLALGGNCLGNVAFSLDRERQVRRVIDSLGGLSCRFLPVSSVVTTMSGLQGYQLWQAALSCIKMYRSLIETLGSHASLIGGWELVKNPALDSRAWFLRARTAVLLAADWFYYAGPGPTRACSVYCTLMDGDHHAAHWYQRVAYVVIVLCVQLSQLFM